MSEEAQDLIELLLEKNPKNRLCANDNDANEVMKHRWFEQIDWDALYNKKLNPPYKPDPSEDGLNYFDEEFTSEDIKVHEQNFSPE
jgi:serine/threonine protein kinase